MDTDFAVYLLLLFTVFISGLLRFKKISVAFKALVILILVIIISELSTRLLIRLIRNSNPPYHLLSLIHYGLFAFMYSKLIRRKKTGRYILLSVIPFTVAGVLNTLYLQPYLTFPSNIIMLSNILFIVFSLMLFMQMLNEPKEISIFRQSIFWFNISVLIYSILMPVCFGVMTYLIKYDQNPMMLMNLMEAFTFIYYGTLGYSIYLDRKDELSNYATRNY